MNAIENWADVEKLIRGLLPPQSMMDEVLVFGWTPDEIAWYERVQAMRVSLDNTPEATAPTQTGRSATET